MAKRVKAFVSVDGSLHMDSAAAQRADVRYELGRWLDRYCKQTDGVNSDMDVDDLIGYIVSNTKSLRAILEGEDVT